MHIAIVSDSHDHIPNLHRAVTLANKKGAEVLIHCGDLISPFMLQQLHAFNGQVHLIYGNNAGDQHLISTRCATEFVNIHHHGTLGIITIGNLRIGINHYPELARALAISGDFDIVCCGHNHIFAIDRFDDCLLINPGDLLGKDTPPGFALLDTRDRSVQQIIAGKQLSFVGEQ